MVLIMDGHRPQARSQSQWFPQFISLWFDTCSSFNDALSSLRKKIELLGDSEQWMENYIKGSIRGLIPLTVAAFAWRH
jgi:hypothetical protein